MTKADAGAISPGTVSRPNPSRRLPVFPTVRALRRLAAGGLLWGWLAAAPVPAGAAGEWLAGADVSALATLEQHGAVHRFGNTAGDALAILRRAGVNCFRLRLFVAPDGRGMVTNDLAYTLALARRVKDSGAALILDIHYSDTWADPAKQTKPAGWADLPFPELVATVRCHTTETLRAFRQAGVAPDLVQLGNEITNGLLWPEGRVDFAQRDDPAAWGRLGELLRAAYAGLDAAFPEGDRPRTILHIESPNQLERALWFCREAQAAQVPYDIIGVSYYPDWHGDLGTLRTSLERLAAEFRKPLLVVETAYPWKPDEHWDGRPHMSWPLTPAGQRRFLHEVVAAVRAVPDGLGLGVVYWHPECVPVPDMGVWVGGSCALFGRRGRLLPAAAELSGPP